VTERRKPVVQATPVPVGPDQFANFGFPSINHKGDVAFLGRYPSPSSPQGVGQAIFIKFANGTWRVVRENEKILNLDAHVTDFTNPVINDNGEVIFIAQFKTAPALQPVNSQTEKPGEPSVPTNGIFITAPTGIKNLIQTNQEVPNMPSKFSGFANVSFNSKGLIAFIGTYADPDGRGLFIMDGENLNLIVRSGQRTGPEGQGVFSEHYYPSTVNERGEVAFFSRISGGGGIFVRRAEKVEAIAIQGKASPITDTKYIGFGQVNPAINRKGEVAFVGFYDGPDGGRALFFKGEGPAQVVAKSGDNIPGTTYNFTGFDRPSINARGEIAFIGTYGGRTRGIFLKTEKGIEVIALSEQKIPGNSKDEYNHFYQPVLNDRGEVIFTSALKSGVLGLFIKNASGVRSFLQRGDKLPPK